MASVEYAKMTLWLLAVLFSGLWVVSGHEVERCMGGNFVCTTLMLYKDGYTADEGPNCDCKTCSNVWNETDGMSITWHHYEKSDRLVQYRFCSNIIPEKICDTQHVAVIMETDVEAWNIRIKSINCQCPGGLYYMAGWWRKGPTWVYTYVCNLPVCSDTDDCTKVYVNSVGAKLGYQFNCVCGEDDLCPTTTEPTLKPQADENGQFVSNQCKRPLSKAPSAPK